MSDAHPAPRGPGWYWTEYWKGGRTEVMTVDTAAGQTAFDPESIWSQFFSGFPDGARLIDLATGAGQVARYAAGAGAEAGRRFEVVGVDYAVLDGAHEPTPPGCTLMGGVALEKLPFPAGGFDGASSQFGIEYADVRLALAELARVLVPGAPVLMLLHHAQSAITKSADDQSRAFDRVFSDDRAIRAARRAFEAHADGRPREAIVKAEAGFGDAVQRLAARLKPERGYEPVRQLVGYLQNLADRAAAYEPASALAHLEAFETGNQAWRQRHRSQLRVALDPEGFAAFLHRAERAGLASVGHEELRDGQGQLIAWKAAFERR